MEWIFPYNIAYYDMDKAIHELDYIEWIANNKVNYGDVIYLYSSKPEQFIKYKCIVSNPHKEFTTNDETKYGGTAPGMKVPCFDIVLDYEFNNPITIDELVEYGLSRKRIPIQSNKSKPRLFEYIRNRETEDKNSR